MSSFESPIHEDQDSMKKKKRQIISVCYHRQRVKIKWNKMNCTFFFLPEVMTKKINLPDNWFFKTIFSKGICSINFKFSGKMVQHVHAHKKEFRVFFLFHKTFLLRDISCTITQSILALFPKCSGNFSKYFTTKWLVHFNSLF